jgi:hypothetical protein
MNLRRLLLALGVIVSALQIPGCATPAQVCDVRQDYRSSAIPTKGEVRVTWEVKSLPAGTYGYATCDSSRQNCHIQVTNRPDYNDVCRVHDFGHELLHALGGSHQ